MILKIQRIKSEIQRVRMVTEINTKSTKQSSSKSRIRPSKRRLLSPRYISLEPSFLLKPAAGKEMRLSFKSPVNRYNINRNGK